MIFLRIRQNWHVALAICLLSAKEVLLRATHRRCFPPKLARRFGVELFWNRRITSRNKNQLHFSTGRQIGEKKGNSAFNRLERFGT